MRDKIDNRDTSFNKCLATACMSKESACCCEGKIFIPSVELAPIRKWLSDKSEEERVSFESALDDDHDGFSLLDQGTRCQFLDDKNLCRLHDLGIKPTECFWWPFHVYVGDDSNLEIRVSTRCCDAYKCSSSFNTKEATESLDLIESAAKKIGHDVIRRFRKVFTTKYNYPVVRVIKNDESND